jgi:hypothetical protein
MSDTDAVIALYRISEGTGALGDFYTCASRWMAEQGRLPNRICVHGEGYGGKWTSFTRTDAKLRRSGFGEVTSIDICALEAGKEAPILDYLVTASYQRAHDYALVAARTDIASLTSPEWGVLLRQLLVICQPVYGIGYERERRLGPMPYAMGIAQGLGYSGPEYDEALSISRWGDKAVRQHVFGRGVLRDVYRWNVLSGVHAGLAVRGKRLAEWISEGNGKRGELVDVGRGAWLWDVPSQRIGEVRTELAECDLISC